jgi:transaldolase/glucose-6-phosphate isomerase
MSDANSAGVVNQLEAVFVSTLEEMRKANTISRIWQKDATVWSDKPEHHKIIANSLGWLTVPQALLGRIGEVEAFAAEARAAGAAPAAP